MLILRMQAFQVLLRCLLLRHAVFQLVCFPVCALGWYPFNCVEDMDEEPRHWHGGMALSL